MLDRESVAAASALERPFADPAFGALGEAELRPLHPAELLAPISGTFDLAEFQAPVHTVHVAQIAVTVATLLGVEPATQRSVLYAALLHDSGVAMCEIPAGAEGSGGHTTAGACVASRFGLDGRIRDAIRCTHGRWDGGAVPTA